MPFVWNWLSRQKFRSEQNAKPSKKKRKQAELSNQPFSFYVQGQPTDHHHRTPLPAHGHGRSRSQTTEPSAFYELPPSNSSRIEDEKEQYFRDLHEFVKEHQNQTPERRPLAFEIFQNIPKSREQNYIGRPGFLSQPDLNQSFPQSRDEYQHRNNWVSWHPERERYDGFGGVEKKGKSPGPFSGFRGQDRTSGFSPPQHVPERERKGGNVKRSESMYGYVPRTTSVQDASDVLLGRGREHVIPARHVNTSIHQFAKSPVSISEEPVEDEDTDVFPQRQRAMTSAPGFNFDRVHAPNGHAMHSPREAARSAPTDTENNSPTKQRNFTKSSSGNDNFYFNSDMLLTSTGRSTFENRYDRFDNEKVKKTQMMSGDDVADVNFAFRNTNGNHLAHYEHRATKNAKKSKQPPGGLPNGNFRLLNDNLSPINNSNDRPGGQENDFFFSPMHLDQIGGKQSSENQQLAGLLSTEGEVLY